MNVILMDDIHSLGNRGDVVRVKDGYARNYLIPRGMAIPTGTGKARHLEHQKKLADDRRRTMLKESEVQSHRLQGMIVEIPVRVGEEDKLYGSVTNSNIADALKEKGFEIDRHKIVLESPIRNLGEHDVTVRLAPEITAGIKVRVLREGETYEQLQKRSREEAKAAAAAETE